MKIHRRVTRIIWRDARILFLMNSVTSFVFIPPDVTKGPSGGNEDVREAGLES
jgi:hypothetical protein